LQILPHQFASGTGKSNGSIMIENARACLRSFAADFTLTGQLFR
jgi:hypothetical protein